MKGDYSELPDKYKEFFKFLNQKHGLVCDVEQMDEIINESRKFFNKSNDSSFIDRVEQLKIFREWYDNLSPVEISWYKGRYEEVFLNL